MKENRVDHFKHKSKSWDMSSMRVKNAKSIADLIVKNINFNDTMTIMDLGAGTGLLSYFIAPHVSKIIAVDNSPSMLEEFKSKASEFDSQTEVIEADISEEDINRNFDGIISSMTIHHVEETKALFSKLYSMLNENGFIAIADLDSEDGSFHSDNTGVHHYGFDRNELEKLAREVGFKDIKFDLASTIDKPHCTFTVFLMTAVK
jgi:cyclopropane fatty-acyl-phospholipid synthase-like methyltransferase